MKLRVDLLNSIQCPCYSIREIVDYLTLWSGFRLLSITRPSISILIFMIRLFEPIGVAVNWQKRNFSSIVHLDSVMIAVIGESLKSPFKIFELTL